MQEDVVTDQWIQQHGIHIRRAAGIFQSPTAWIKIDNTGNIVAAGQRDQTILAWLVDQQTLSSADVDYGIAYVTCRSAERAYRRQMGFKSSLDLSFLAASGSLSCEQAAQVYCLMRQHIGKKYCQIIEYACDTIRSPETPVNRHPRYREAFNALAKAFDKAVKAVREGTVIDEPKFKD